MVLFTLNFQQRQQENLFEDVSRAELKRVKCDSVRHKSHPEDGIQKDRRWHLSMQLSCGAHHNEPIEAEEPDRLCPTEMAIRAHLWAAPKVL